MSLTRSTLRDLRALARRNFREEQDLFLIEGFRMMLEAAGSNFEFVEIYMTHKVAEDPKAKALLHKLQLKAKLVPVTEKELESFTDTVQAQGIAAVLRQKHVAPESLLRHDDGRSIIVAADAISDPGNLGSMIRSCDWFAIDAMALGATSVDLYNPKVVRSTMGGLFHLPVVDNVDLPVFLSKAKSSGYTIYVTDAEGTTHFDRIQYASKSLVVFGNEAWGVSEAVKKLADARVVIRRYGTGESLNVGVACGIVLSSIRRLYD
jgi:RNA methyltransferase, TrmH family